MNLVVFTVGFFSFLSGFTLAWVAFHRRGYEVGFSHGESYGRHAGYRQAWLKQMRYRRMGALQAIASDRYEEAE